MAKMLHYDDSMHICTLESFIFHNYSIFCFVSNAQIQSAYIVVLDAHSHLQ